MSRELFSVYIPYENYEDFEVFLFEQLSYPNFGYVRMVEADCQVYMLDLEPDDVTMITLRYTGASVVSYSGGRPSMGSIW